MVRIVIGVATSATMSAVVFVSSPPTTSRASWSTIGRQVCNALRVSPGVSCLRIRVCTG